MRLIVSHDRRKMANTNKKTGAKPKAAPNVTHLEEWATQNQENGKNSANPPDSVKPAQAAKKVGKEQKVPVPEVAPEVTPEAAAPIEAPEEKIEKVKAGKVKGGKVKEAKEQLEPVVSKKGEVASEKATKMKRLTLDIAKPLHKAIKARAVEEGIPMVDMLRSLLEEHYGQ
jgi:predicted DNA binding CopG/RHH family protein